MSARKRKKTAGEVLCRDSAGRLLCPYCQSVAVLRPIKAVYGRDFGDPNAMVYCCDPCDARVGCHQGGTEPLGNLADAATRQARVRAHAAFDPLWQAKMRRDGCSKGFARGKGYKWLAAQLGIQARLCHISWMDEATANRVTEVCLAARQRPPQTGASQTPLVEPQETPWMT